MSLEDRAFEVSVDAFRSATARDADGAATRARVLASEGQRVRRRATFRRAGFAATVGLAAALSGRAAWTAIGRWRADTAATTVAAPEHPLGARTPERVERPVAPPRGTSLERAASAARPGASRAATNVMASTRLPEDGETRAYGRAHAAHFQADDPPRALTLWDEYLHHYPRGAFAPEARFNRALCLLRMGRRQDARAALQPFAAGTFNGYREREARTLLDWTDAPQPPDTLRAFP